MNTYFLDIKVIRKNYYYSELITVYYVVRCSNCGTPQYIRETQKTRTCPKCRKKIKCQTLKILAKAENIHEALQIVQTMKSPNKYELKIEEFKAKLQGTKKNQEILLGDLLSELILLFPNQLPKSYLIENAKNIGLDLKKLEANLLKLSQAGLMLINKDFRPGSTDLLLKFPSIPFTFGKINIRKKSKK
ncbi:DUF1922 domain-containing protein [Candidatus Harpocratesius sp.]